MQYPMLDCQSISANPQCGLAMGIPGNRNVPVDGERIGVCLTLETFSNHGSWTDKHITMDVSGKS